MKTPFLFLVAGWIFLSAAARGAESAHARLYCVSLQCQTALAISAYDGARWTLDLTTITSGNNGELAPGFLTGSYTHSAYFSVYNDLTAMSDSGLMAFDVPTNTGADGFPIIFEISEGVTNLTTAGGIQSSSSSTGYYPSPGAGFTATWNRPAGSATGTCSFQLPDPDNGYYDYLLYTFGFTILECTGPLSYTPGSNVVVAAVNLTQDGDNLASSNTLQGPIILDKSSIDRFNTLTNEPGVWTNAALQTLAFTNELFTRDPHWPTNYSGFVFFADGDPSTAQPDYQWWVLSIDDTNDANANGIPDFSDNPAVVAPPRPPQLSLMPGATNLWLTISGDTGHTNVVQQISSLVSTNWQTALSFLLTNSPQVIFLPLPAGATEFWRVSAQ